MSRTRTRIEGFVLSPPLRGLEALQLRIALQSMGLKEIKLDLDCSGLEDRAKGVRLTERGREVAQAPIRATPPPPTADESHRRASRDKRGRRLGHQRQSPF